MDESQPTKLVAHDTSVVKTKTTATTPITVDIKRICSVRKSDKFKKQNLKHLEENGLDKPIIIVPNTYGNYVQIKGERDNCMPTWLKSFPFLAYTGNELLTIARKLKYDGISCVIAEDIKWAKTYKKALNY